MFSIAISYSQYNLHRNQYNVPSNQPPSNASSPIITSKTTTTKNHLPLNIHTKLNSIRRIANRIDSTDTGWHGIDNQHQY